MESCLTTAIEIAREAGGLLLQHFRQPLEITYKRRSDLVTEADRKSEILIVERLRSHFPDHAIVAEEGGGQKTGSDYCWYVDPLDGTTNFAHGFPVLALRWVWPTVVKSWPGWCMTLLATNSLRPSAGPELF